MLRQSKQPQRYTEYMAPMTKLIDLEPKGKSVVGSNGAYKVDPKSIFGRNRSPDQI